MSGTEKGERLTWEDGAHTSCNGFAGGFRLFSITWKSRRQEPNWLMRCDLPGLAGKEWKNDDLDALKAEAADLLAAWLRRVDPGGSSGGGGGTVSGHLVREHVPYPLALTVHYERNTPDALESDWNAPHGFAVVCVGDFVVHMEPLHPGSAGEVDRYDLEEAAAKWLAKISGEEAEQ